MHYVPAVPEGGQKRAPADPLALELQKVLNPLSECWELCPGPGGAVLLTFWTIDSSLRQVLLWSLGMPGDYCVTPGWPRLAAILLTLSLIAEVTQCRIMPKNLELGALCSLKIVVQN